MTPTPNWPTQPGYYIVENVVPAEDRLDGLVDEGPKTIRRVIEVDVVTEGYGDSRTWTSPGVYMLQLGVDGLRPIQSIAYFQGLRFIPIDLDEIVLCS